VPHPTPDTCAVLAHSRLVGEALSVGLEARGLGVLRGDLPEGRAEQIAVRRSLAVAGVRLGLVVADLDELAQWRDVLSVVEVADLPWLVVTGSQDLARWGALLDLGCRGIVPMTAGLDSLADAIDAVRRGVDAMAPPARDAALDAWRGLPVEQRELVRRVGTLSGREWVVLESLTMGLTLRDIAAHAGVSEGTVRSQMRTIRQKLNVSSQLAAVAAFQQTLDLRLGPAVEVQG
jgi:two-component system nitrate/nitrite response regulator NarL